MVFVCDIRIFRCRISRIFWRYQAKSGYTDNDQNNVTQTEDVNTFMRQRDCQLKKVCCWKYFSTDFGPNKTTDLPLHFLFHLNLGQLMPKFSETETKNRPSKLINLILLAQKVTGMRDCVCYHSNWSNWSNFPFFCKPPWVFKLLKSNLVKSVWYTFAWREVSPVYLRSCFPPRILIRDETFLGFISGTF